MTFLGMAAGPFLGAAILGRVPPGGRAVAPGRRAGLARRAAPRPRLALGVLRQRPDRDRRARHRLGREQRLGDADAAAAASTSLGAVLFSAFLARRARRADAARRQRDRRPAGLDPATVAAVLAGVAVVARRRWRSSAASGSATRSSTRGCSARASFSSARPRLRRSPGYGFATAIVGGAVFVDRVLYGGADEQRLALGALAGATAVGRPRVRVRRAAAVAPARDAGRASAASIVGLWLMSGWTTDTPIAGAAAPLALFGAGFGLTVTPRSTAAVAAVGREAYGMASSTVTVARMVGMAVGLAILTAYGSTTIDRLYDQVYATPDAYLAVHPRVAPGPAAARRRWSSRRSRPGRPARRRGSWSGCSSSRRW